MNRYSASMYPDGTQGNHSVGTDTGQTSLGLLRGRSVFIETYGCRYNFGDTAKLIEILRYQGSSLVDSPDRADAIIINTCTVVGPTERRMLRRLSTFRDRDLFVTGCMAEAQREAVLAVCTPVFISPETIHNLYRTLGTVSPGSVGIVQLARGCAGHCTYCVTRYARGPLKSFPRAEILAQVRAFVQAGAVEIQLTAQDVGAWGMDTGESLPVLLSEIGRIPGSHRIRIGMMNPATVKDQAGELADVVSGDHFFSFLHLPVQSGSDAVLTRMGRGYSVGEFEEIVRAFRAKNPAITLATDMITGFPGETPGDFAASLDLIRRVKPSKVHVTRYSPRPFTPAAREKGFPDSIRKDRSREMNACARDVYSAANAGSIGKIVPFLVTETLRKGSVMARAPDYTGIILNEDLPAGFSGEAILTEDKAHFFVGRRVQHPR